MKNLTSLMLIGALLLLQGPLAAQAPAPVYATTATINGTAVANDGRRLSNLTMRARNQTGTVSMTTTMRDGTFMLPGLAVGVYTVECVKKGEVIGSASVTLAAPSSSVNVTCASDAPAAIDKKKIVAALGAAAIAIGAAAVVSGKSAASPAQ